MPDGRPSIAILGVTGVEPQVQGKGLVFGLIADELNATVDDQFRFVAQTAVGLFLVEGIATNRLKLIEVVLPAISLGHLGVPLAGEPGPVARLAQDSRVEMLDRIGGGKIVLPGSTEASAGEPRQDGGPADPANGLTDERVGKARAVLGQTVDIGRLGKRMPIATERARGLVVGKEEDDIGTLGIQFAKEKKEEAGEAEESMFHDF